MFKAHALYFSLIISLLLAVMCSGLILFHQFQKKTQTRFYLKEKLIHQVESGLALATINDNDYQSDTLSYKTNRWGIYKVASASSFNSLDTINKNVLLGSIYKNNFALYLMDQKQELTLCGKTKLKGKCFIPKAGVVRGYIAGRNYSGTQLVYGSITNSTSQLPFFSSDEIKSIYENLSYFREGTGLDSNELINSFSSPTIIVQSPSTVNGRFKGNIILTSFNPIIISRQAKLEDIIIIAPIIIIKNGFKGNIQCFASKEIIVEESSTLLYPSCLGLFKQVKNDTLRPSITIEGNCKIKGVIFSDQQTYDRAGTIIKILDNAKIEGEVMTTGMLELKGEVKGSVQCRKFYLNTASSVYDNFLLDAVVNQRALNKLYYGSAISNNELKWPIKTVY